MRKSYKMRTHVWRRVIFGPREIRKKLGTNAKDGSATTERDSARRWFHHIYFAMLSAPRVNRLAKGQGYGHSISSQVVRTVQPY
jgi:hypothetical protein